MTTEVCANVLCNTTAGGWVGGGAPPQWQNLDKDWNKCFLPPLLIWQCDVTSRFPLTCNAPSDIKYGFARIPTSEICPEHGLGFRVCEQGPRLKLIAARIL